jgi:hypothetical protein
MLGVAQYFKENIEVNDINSIKYLLGLLGVPRAQLPLQVSHLPL